MTSSRPVIAASVLARLVYGLDRVTTMPQGGSPGRDRELGTLAGAICGVARLAAARARRRAGLERRGPGRDRASSVPSVSGCARPNCTVDVRLGDVVGRDAAAGRALTRRSRDVRVEDRLPVVHRADDRRPSPTLRLDELVDDRGRRVGARPQALLLLLAEVVVDPVDDDRRDEGERQRDDADEREREARLERARHGRAARGPCVGRPAVGGTRCGRAGRRRGPVRRSDVGHVSARRTGSRRRGRSARTAAPTGRPRSCRAGGSRGR